MLATVLQGLVPGVPYRAEVAAATGAGVGARSAPVPIRIGECPRCCAAPMCGGYRGPPWGGCHGWLLGTRRCPHPPLLAAPPVEQEAGPVGRGGVAEHLAEMARRPAFIAGIGGACWLVLAGFGAWLYGRRRRRKELSHFTGKGTGTALGAPDPLAPSAHTGFLSLQPPLPTRPRVHPWVLQGPAAAPVHPRPSIHLSLRSPFCTPRLRREAAPGNSTAPWDLQPTRGCALSLCPHRAAAGGHPWLVDTWCGGGTSSLDTAERYYNGEGSAWGWGLARGWGWQPALTGLAVLCRGWHLPLHRPDGAIRGRGCRGTHLQQHRGGRRGAAHLPPPLLAARPRAAGHPVRPPGPRPPRAR